jgi:dUTP pyrophosphatase
VVVEAVEGTPTARIPVRATSGSACFDLEAAEAVELVHGRVTLVRTGLRVRCPPGTFLEVRPRSGLSSRGVLMVNAPGTIDRDYSGEVRVPMTYLFDGSYAVRTGDRIGQVRLVEDLPTRFRTGKVRAVPGRSGGFGSTGR